MIQKFDTLLQYEIPDYILCNPDGSKLYNLSGIYNREIGLRFNAISTIKFTAQKVLDGVDAPYYDKLVGKRRIFIDNIGVFIITSVVETSDGANISKDVVAKSLEFELSYKKILSLEGTWQFYNPLDTTISLIHKIMSYIPNWTIGTIDASLMTMFRTFNEKDTSVYALLMSEVSQAYQCVFSFDTFNHKISVASIDNAVQRTDIFLSYGNLLKNTSIDENSDQIVTALNVYGKDDLSINQVNPLGSDTIYNFSYFKNSAWMSQGLIDAINAWDIKVASYVVTYATQLTEYMTQQQSMNVLKTAPAVYFDADKKLINPTTSGLSALETNLANKRNLLKIQIDMGNTDVTVYQDAVALAEQYVNSKNTAIAALQQLMNAKLSQLTQINDEVKLESNFTVAQLSELSNFIFAGSYDNRNFLQTENMSLTQIQDMAMDLYEQGKVISNKVCYPRIEFSLDIHNFIFLEYFKPFTDQLQLGSSITVDMDEDDGLMFAPIVLGFDYNYDDPEKFKFLLSNRMRLANSEIELADISSDSDRTVSAVKYTAGEWGSWTDDGENTVNGFIEEALNASLDSLLSSDNQELTFTNAGLIGKQKTGDTYSPRQIWLTSNQLAFTRDNWAHVNLALGNITVGGQSVYGIVADAVIGKLIVGNSLTIENNNKTFTVDGTGVKLVNADFVSTSTTTNAKITISPTNPLLVQKKDAGNWINQFSVDQSGNITMIGNITATSGTFTGTVKATSGNIGTWTIDAAGLTYNNGTMYLKPSGVKLGGMTYVEATGKTTFTGELVGASGTFSGTVSAANLLGTVQWSQIVNVPIPASQINGGSGYSLGGFTLGSLAPTRIGAGRWDFGTGSLGSTGGAGGSLIFNTAGMLEASGGSMALVGFGIGIDAKGGNITLYSNGVYRYPASFANSVLFVGDGDGRYAAITHYHTSTYAPLTHYHTGYASTTHYHTQYATGSGVGGYVYVVSAGGDAKRLDFTNGVLTNIYDY